MFYDKYSIANKKLKTDFGVQVKKIREAKKWTTKELLLL